MMVSEKSLELNVGAELLFLLRNRLGMPKTYLRGLTQAEEKQQGVDFFAQLSPSTRIFAFQFKAPKGRDEGTPYRYTLVKEQHDLLFALAQGWPDSVFYVFPFYVTPEKLQQDVPNLLQDTWLLELSRMVPSVVFAGQKTKVVNCQQGRAIINPEYELYNVAKGKGPKFHGISAIDFASWYRLHRGEDLRQNKRRNPWLVRGLRLAIVETRTQNRLKNT